MGCAKGASCHGRAVTRPHHGCTSTGKLVEVGLSVNLVPLTGSPILSFRGPRIMACRQNGLQGAGCCQMGLLKFVPAKLQGQTGKLSVGLLSPGMPPPPIRDWPGLLQRCSWSGHGFPASAACSSALQMCFRHPAATLRLQCWHCGP